MNKNDIVLITCEASLEPEVSFELGRDWGISQYELRQVFSPDTRVNSESGEGSQWAVLGTGKVDWRDQLRALNEIDYSGFLSIESHTFYDKVKTTKENYDTLCRWLSEI